jgi:hypothetical protein
MRQLTALASVVGLTLVVAISLGCVRWDNKDQIQGSGVARTDQRDVEKFEELSLMGGMDAVVTIGDQQSVTIEADDNVLPIIETKVEDGKLIVVPTENYRAKTPVKLTITVPQLKGVAINGSGDVDVNGLNGASSFAVAINGSGDVTAKGTADAVSVAVRGSGDVKLQDLQAKNGKVAVAGSGDVTVNATDKLDVSVAGSGDVKYMGSPKITKSIAGSGSVRKVG